MAKSKTKAKQVFSLKNFVIMFIAIGTLVGLAFWAGRQTKSQTQAAAVAVVNNSNYIIYACVESWGRISPTQNWNRVRYDIARKNNYVTRVEVRGDYNTITRRYAANRTVSNWNGYGTLRVTATALIDARGESSWVHVWAGGANSLGIYNAKNLPSCW